jgi:hypothetical protein
LETARVLGRGEEEHRRCGWRKDSRKMGKRVAAGEDKSVT